ncbi:MAG TPA: hypothetical protein VKQ36_07010, partial [Ktedonobacterales bacterium]|nr:hypothetical protein [Ktedonobacterales bacterium]
DEAPPQYADIRHEIDLYVAQGKWEPSGLFALYPHLTDNHYQRIGAFATAIIERHPVEFLEKTIPYMFLSTTVYRPWSKINPVGHFATLFRYLTLISTGVHDTYWLFFIVGLFWVGLLFWRPTAHRYDAEAMAGLYLLAIYETIMLAFGSINLADVARIQIPIHPIFLVIVWGTILGVLTQIVTGLRPAGQTTESTQPALTPSPTPTPPAHRIFSESLNSIPEAETFPMSALPPIHPSHTPARGQSRDKGDTNAKRNL